MIVKYRCNLCDNAIDKLISKPSQVKGVLPCQCGGFLERRITPPSSNSVELIDDGVVVKKTYFDAQRYELARKQGDDIIKEKNKKKAE